MKPSWLTIAESDLALREIPGARTEPRIAAWLIRLGAWWRDDETPWCGTALAAWMDSAGAQVPKKWYRAKAWLEWGEAILEPVLGCVVVFERAGGGHVGLVVGRDARGNLMVLGGNQGDEVSIRPFSPARVLGYRWPPGHLHALIPADLPLLASNSPISRNEA